MRRLRILLVEDDDIIRALVAEILVILGHDICGIARTETEAVDEAVRHVPDLMIVDAQLAAGDGVSAMNTIERRTAMPHIFMTGGSRVAIPAGAHVLSKPFNIAGLARALDRAAGKTAAFAGGVVHPQP